MKVCSDVFLVGFWHMFSLFIFSGLECWNSRELVGGNCPPCLAVAVLCVAVHRGSSLGRGGEGGGL